MVTLMNIVTLIVAGVAALATAVSTGVAIYSLRFNKQTVEAYREQIRIGQEQVRASQSQTYNQLRPVLIPPKIEGSDLLKGIPGAYEINWNQVQLSIDGLRNIGVGPALNINCIFFPPSFQGTPPETQRYSVWNYGAITPGETGEKIILRQGTNLTSTTIIGGQLLHVPDDADHINRIVRLTMTYRDVFGRKFASMYDYQRVLGWVPVGNFEDIEHDLAELEQANPATQMTDQFFHALGKSRGVNAHS